MSLLHKFSAAKKRDIHSSVEDVQSIRRKVETDFAELAFYSLDLKRGLQRKEFKVLYLPKIDLASGDILAVKAVLRWDHPHRGLLPPQSFILYAEKVGIMPAIGNWMMEQVLEDIKEMRSMGLSPLPVTIALTEKQCQSPNLVPKVKSLLSKEQFSPNEINFEVPQKLQGEDDPVKTSNLRVLRWLGVEYSGNQSDILDEIGSRVYPTPADDGPLSVSSRGSTLSGYCYGTPKSFEEVCENLFERMALAV